MSIATVVTMGYGNGTLSGTIPFVSTMGYTIGAAIVLTDDGFLVGAPKRTFEVKARRRTLTVFVPKRTFTTEVKPGGRIIP